MSIADRRGNENDGTGRRWTSKPKHKPEDLRHLKEESAAIVENRTLFPKSLVSAIDSPRVLISGVNSIKLGRQVKKGEWAGFPIFQLSLEERASCPPTCNNRLTCYGNAMPFARRHRMDSSLVPAIAYELAGLQELHPTGFVVRLHVLGDFFSIDYVHAWLRFLDHYPALHIFGYTAWSRDSDIGALIASVSNDQWSRFAIRFSSDISEPQGATTIWRTPTAATVPEGIVCPAQTDATACCATCGLCWAKGSKDKTIVFVGHGGIGLGGRGRKAA